MDMVSAAKAARAKAAKLKLCDSLAVYLQELAPKVDEGPAQAAKAIDHGGMQVMGKGHGDSAETDPWAALGGTKKGKKKKGKAKASGGLQHSMIRLNGFAEVSRRRPVSRGHADTRTRGRLVRQPVRLRALGAAPLPPAAEPAARPRDRRQPPGALYPNPASSLCMPYAVVVDRLASIRQRPLRR